LIEKDSGTIRISVPEKYREDRLRHWLTTVLTRSALVTLVMYVVVNVVWHNPHNPPQFLLIPAVCVLASGLPGWFTARQTAWTYVIDQEGVRIVSGKTGNNKVNPGGVPTGVVWANHNIAEVDRSTELELPKLMLYSKRPSGSLRHRLSLVYEPDDSRGIQNDVLPLIDNYRSKSEAK